VSPGDLTTLSDRFVKANGRLHDLKKQQTDLEAKLAHDYGLEGAFGALVDKCYDAQVNPKPYTLNPPANLPNVLPSPENDISRKKKKYKDNALSIYKDDIYKDNKDFSIGQTHILPLYWRHQKRRHW